MTQLWWWDRRFLDWVENRMQIVNKIGVVHLAFHLLKALVSIDLTFEPSSLPTVASPRSRQLGTKLLRWTFPNRASWNRCVYKEVNRCFLSFQRWAASIFVSNVCGRWSLSSSVDRFTSSCATSSHSWISEFFRVIVFQHGFRKWEMSVGFPLSTTSFTKIAPFWTVCNFAVSVTVCNFAV